MDFMGHTLWSTNLQHLRTGKWPSRNFVDFPIFRGILVDRSIVLWQRLPCRLAARPWCGHWGLHQWTLRDSGLLTAYYGHWYMVPMTDPNGAGRKMQHHDWGFVDGIHGAPYVTINIAAPWIRHGVVDVGNHCLSSNDQTVFRTCGNHRESIIYK